MDVDQLLPVAAQTGVFGIAFVVVYWLFRQQVTFLEKQVEMWQRIAERGTVTAERGTDVAADLVEPLRRRAEEDERLRQLEAAVQVLLRRADRAEETS